MILWTYRLVAGQTQNASMDVLQSDVFEVCRETQMCRARSRAQSNDRRQWEEEAGGCR